MTQPRLSKGASPSYSETLRDEKAHGDLQAHRERFFRTG
jgi:hypothetical protein